MAIIGTYFEVSDNTGAKKLLCLKNLSRKTTIIKVGDLIVGVVKVASTKGVVKKSDIVYAIVIRTKKSFRYNDGTIVRFKDNAVVLVDKKYIPLGTRIFGAVSKVIKIKQFYKLSSLATELV
uniref:Ribosomal protein L14 n=1 Tax=Apicomplexa sp. corallicolid ex Leiopathes glaberrima TaxID=2720216 RepID=A0A6M3R6H1_9APIC|nr:ribosomal protein L14 [Apicomplexa sp. corallicolid ex Leiopathes glaberrima]